MVEGFHSPSPRGREIPPSPQLLAVDPNAPLVREFVLRNLLRGTIRVFPGGPGTLFLLPTGIPPVMVARPLQARG